MTIDAQRIDRAPTHDVEFVLLEPRALMSTATDELQGRLMAAAEYAGRRSLTVVETIEDGRRVVQAHFHGLARATMELDGSVVELTLAAGADPEIAPILFNGTLMAMVLALRGHPVLHSSAVTVTSDGSPVGLGFVGRSGMGKSTMATLICRDGGRLLTDDVLRTDLHGDDRVVAWPGAQRTRLRAAATSLARSTGDDVISTADGRLSPSLPTAGDEPIPLVSLAVPQPDRDATAPSIRQLHGAEKVMALASFPRIVGWIDPATTGAAHEHWGQLARRLPLSVVTIPWGPPFAAGLGRHVAELLLTETVD